MSTDPFTLDMFGNTALTSGLGVGLTAFGGFDPIAANDDEPEPTPPAPLLGTHTDEVLHEVLGLDGAAVGRLHDAGVVAGPERDPTAG